MEVEVVGEHFFGWIVGVDLFASLPPRNDIKAAFVVDRLEGIVDGNAHLVLVFFVPIDGAQVLVFDVLDQKAGQLLAGVVMRMDDDVCTRNICGIWSKFANAYEMVRLSAVPMTSDKCSAYQSGTHFGTYDFCSSSHLGEEEGCPGAS